MDADMSVPDDKDGTSGRDALHIRLLRGEPTMVLPAIPGHAHIVGADGSPTCGCRYQALTSTLATASDGDDEPGYGHGV